MEMGFGSLIQSPFYMLVFVALAHHRLARSVVRCGLCLAPRVCSYGASAYRNRWSFSYGETTSTTKESLRRLAPFTTVL